MWFRKHVGLVNQEPVLFANAIADNISYGKHDATESEVRTVYTAMATQSAWGEEAENQQYQARSCIAVAQLRRLCSS